VLGAPKKGNLSVLVTQAASYAEVYAAFRWSLPERYNIAWDVCDRHAAEAGKVALIHEQPDGAVRRYTFDEIQRCANRLANVLTTLGLVRGDRVMLLLSQNPATAFAHVACWKAGFVSVPTSVLFGVDALEYRLNHSGARVLITDAANAPRIQTLRERAPTLENVLLIDGEDSHAASVWELMQRASDSFHTLALTPDTPAFLSYTSGTTGWPKGALHGHRCMIGHMPGLEVLYDFFPREGDLLWSPADWSWIAGLMDVLMPAWFHGKPVLVYHTAGFDAEQALFMIGRHQVRNVLLTPTVLKLMRIVPDACRRFDVQLRSIISGSEAVGRDLLEEMSARLDVTINEGFGQTECNVVLGNCAGLNHMKVGSLGVAMPGHIAAVVDNAGVPLGPGELGNLAFKRPDPVMLLKYWEDGAATAEKFAGDWLITGDLTVADGDGFFWFKGRSDDLIKSSGYRIGPSEIEDAIGRHAGVMRAAVIGVPNRERGEIVKAFVVLRPGHVGSEELKEEIRLSVRDRLAKHEYPREIEFVDALPMTTTGKVMRRELREREKRRGESR
jgi:acetyl-CoA synthetase